MRPVAHAEQSRRPSGQGPDSGRLGFDVFRSCLVLTDLRVGLIDRGSIISCVDGCEQIACSHDLIIGDIDADNTANDLRADQHRPAIDKGIVRTLVMTGVKIPCDARNDADSIQSRRSSRLDASGRRP
jgi:hypothetical protein